MLEYLLAVSNNTNCMVSYSDKILPDLNRLEGCHVLRFDEDHIINKTIEIAEPDKCNVYFIMMCTDDIMISNIFTASSIGELAHAAYSLLASNDNIYILYACQLKDKKHGLYASDAYVAVPPVQPGTIGPITNDLRLVTSIRNYVRLLELLNKGEYPLDGHKIIDHEGGLQPWYPDGGIKGHKRKLLSEGYKFIDEYKVDMKQGIR